MQAVAWLRWLPGTGPTSDPEQPVAQSGNITAHVLGLFVLVLVLDAGVEIDWTAPQECPSSAEITAWVGELTTSAPAEPLVVTGLVHARAGNYVLDLSWQRGARREHEQLVGHDCDELGQLAALLIATELDPFAFAGLERPDDVRALESRRDSAEDVESEPIEPEPIEPEPIESAPIEPQSIEPAESIEPESIEPEQPGLPRYDLAGPPSQVSSPQRRRMDVNGYFLAEGHGFLNLLPNPGAGPRLGVGLELAHARVLLGGAGWFGSGFRSPTDPEVGGRISAWSLELHGCGVPSWRRLSVPLCGQLGAGQALGSGFGVDQPLDATQPWLWLGADASLEWWVRPRFALRAGLGLGISLVRPSFEIVDTDARFESPIVFGRAIVGVATRFGGSGRSRQTDPRRADNQQRP